MTSTPNPTYSNQSGDSSGAPSNNSAVSAPKFTPGPWRLDGDHVYGWDTTFGEGAVALPLGITAEDAHANGHLIAAAPELFEALKNLADNIEHAWPSLARLGPLVDARAALAKAQGDGA